MGIGEPKRTLIVEPLVLPEPIRQPQQLPAEPVIKPELEPEPNTLPDEKTVPA